MQELQASKRSFLKDTAHLLWELLHTHFSSPTRNLVFHKDRNNFSSFLPSFVLVETQKLWVQHSTHSENQQTLQFSRSVVSNSLVCMGPHELQHACLSITSSQSLLKLMSITSMMPSNHLILCHPPLFLPSIFPSIRVSSKESVLCIRWPKYWSFTISTSLPNDYSGLISFRIDWFDLLAVQGTLKSILQHHTSKASIL